MYSACTHTKVHRHIHLKCIQTLKIIVTITYTELLDQSPGGPVGVGEGHVRRRRAIVPRNVREPSKEVSVPRRGVVDRPHRLTSTRHLPTSRRPLDWESPRRRGNGTCVSLVTTGPWTWWSAGRRSWAASIAPPVEPQLIACPPRPTAQQGEVLQCVAWKNINLRNAITIVKK
jgi:hypothetical protein